MRDPTSRLKPSKKEVRAPKALSIEELELLRESCKTIRQRALLEVMYADGRVETFPHDGYLKIDILRNRGGIVHVSEY